jgi:hypothetical protein
VAGKLVLTSLITSCMHHAGQVASRYQALRMLEQVATALGPEEDALRLDRILPHLMHCLQDEQARIRHAALLQVQRLVTALQHISASEACIIADYVLPAMHHLACDPAPYLRVAYVYCLPELAAAGLWMLEVKEDVLEYEECKLALLQLVQQEIAVLLTGG